VGARAQLRRVASVRGDRGVIRPTRHAEQPDVPPRFRRRGPRRPRSSVLRGTSRTPDRGQAGGVMPCRRRSRVACTRFPPCRSASDPPTPARHVVLASRREGGMTSWAPACDVSPGAHAVAGAAPRGPLGSPWGAPREPARGRSTSVGQWHVPPSVMSVASRVVDMVPSHPGPPLGWDGSSCPTQRPHTPTVHAFGTLGRSGRLRQVRSVGMFGYLGHHGLGSHRRTGRPVRRHRRARS
jgi:hypothetical protein